MIYPYAQYCSLYDAAVLFATFFTLFQQSYTLLLHFIVI